MLGLALAAAPMTAAAAEVEHVVSRGQTLVRIARRYRTTVDILREVNGLEPKDLLRPGQRLIIPERGKEAEAAKRAAAMRKEAERKEAERREKEAERKGAGRKGKNEGRKGGKQVRADEKASKEARTAEEERKAGYARKPKRPGFVRMVRNGETLDVQLLTRSGRLNPKALSKLTRLLRAPGGEHPVDPRLATLIGLVSDHFGGRTIRVVSGYRPYSPTQYTPHSNHNVGRAMDFAVEGVPNTVVRDFCRTLRNAGVGYYPNSTFVHLDVRTVKTYWVDYSRPGEAPRYNARAPRRDAEEAVHDMAEAPQAEGDTGSDRTHPPAAEIPASKGGKQNDPGSAPEPGEKMGPSGPGATEEPDQESGDHP